MNPLLAHSKPGISVSCNNCRHSFRQDPVFEVSCPVCKAAPGSYCKRPSGHSGPFVAFHAERDLKALQEGFYDHPGKSGCGPNSFAAPAHKSREAKPAAIGSLQLEISL